MTRPRRASVRGHARRVHARRVHARKGHARREHDALMVLLPAACGVRTLVGAFSRFSSPPPHPFHARLVLSFRPFAVVYTGDNLLCHLCSAICSGFVASLCSTPADVAKSRIMSQTAGPDGKMPYAGTLDCWRKVVASEGFLALYKGFMPGWLRLGPWQLVFWCSYEQLRILSGLGGFK